jgi:hypothetical protein
VLAGALYLAAIYVGGALVPTFMATGSVTSTYRGGRFLSVMVFIPFTMFGYVYREAIDAGVVEPVENEETLGARF